VDEPGRGGTADHRTLDVLQGLSGDRAVHWSPDCAVLKCCIDERKPTHCSDCKGFPCRRLEEWAEQGAKYEAALVRQTELRSQDTPQVGPEAPRRRQGLLQAPTPDPIQNPCPPSTSAL
jgi:hypothetical protein